MIDLILDDCMNVMKKYDDNHFDLAIVDPPYGINVCKTGKVELKCFANPSMIGSITHADKFKTIAFIKKNILKQQKL